MAHLTFVFYHLLSALRPTSAEGRMSAHIRFELRGAIQLFDGKWLKKWNMIFFLSIVTFCCRHGHSGEGFGLLCLLGFPVFGFQGSIAFIFIL